MRDRAAVNNVAMQTLKIAFQIVCFILGVFHTLDHVGEKFNTPIQILIRHMKSKG